MAVTWATVEDVTDALGAPVSAADDAHLLRCVAAANAFGYRRRRQAGYVDTEDVAPGDDALLGVIVYAVALFKERGSVDSFTSFEAFSAGAVPVSTFGQVLRLLGVGRPAVDADPYTAAVVAARAAYHRPRVPYLPPVVPW